MSGDAVMARRYVWAWLAVAPALLGVVSLACMSPGQRREESLQRVAHEFNDGMRWNREDQVMRCLLPGEARLLRARAPTWATIS